MTERIGLTTLDTTVDLSDANVSIIDPVNQNVARSFPLCRLMSTARQTQLKDGELKVRPQHIKFNMLVTYLSQPKFKD
jgi:hypothetical protein